VDDNGPVGDDGMSGVTMVSELPRIVRDLEDRIEKMRIALSRVPKAVRWGQFELTPYAEMAHVNKLLAGWEETYGE
jgi:hypothetical protein